MALNINTKLTNNLDGYLMDAKNVKGTYVVVANYSDLANLPEATVEEGSLAYCQNYYMSYEAGFYQYKNAIDGWEKIELENPEPVEISITGNFDPTQTFTFTIDSGYILPLMYGTSLVISFTGGGVSVFHPDFFQISQTEYTSSAVVVLNETQYIATINFDLSIQSNNATLSFQELQAGGSGGGGTTPSDSVGDNYIISFTAEKTLTNPGDQSDVRTVTDKYQLLISEKVFENFMSENQEFSVSTLPGLVDYVNNNPMLKNTVLVYMLIGMASTCSASVWKYELDGEYHLNQVIVQNTDFTKIANENYTSMSNWTIENIPDKIGGSSEGAGGSGKLYEISMQLTRYDENGDILPWGTTSYEYGGGTYDLDVVGGGSIPTLNELTLSFNIYESNYEFIKTKFNPLLTAQGITPINTIQDLVSFINTYWNETQMDTSGDGYTLTEVGFQIGQLINYVDKAFMSFTSNGQTATIPIDTTQLAAFIIATKLTCLSGISGSNYSFALQGYGDVYFGLNANNSCTLTEYGTSGSGGGVGATRTKYRIEVEDNNNQKAIIPIYKDDFDKYLVELNQVGNQLGQSTGNTWTNLTDINGLKAVFDELKGDQTLSFACDLAMNLLVKYAYESGENPILNFGDIYIWSVNRITNYDLANNQLGSILSLEYDSQDISTLGDLYWFKYIPLANNEVITIDSNATFTYTEEQIAGGGSGSGETTTKTIYEFTLKTSTDGNEISTDNYNEMYVELSENKFNEFLEEINILLPGNAINNAEDFTDFIENSSLSLGNAVLCLLVKHSLNENRNPWAIFKVNPAHYCYALGVADLDISNQVIPQVWSWKWRPAGSVEDNQIEYWFSDQTNAKNSYFYIGGTGDDEYHTFTYSTRQEISGGGSGGGSAITETGGIDVVKLACEYSTGNWININFLFKQGDLESQDIVDTINYSINNLNQTFTLSIPNYATKEDLVTINEYLVNLPSSANAVKIMVYSSLGTLFNYLSISSEIKEMFINNGTPMNAILSGYRLYTIANSTDGYAFHIIDTTNLNDIIHMEFDGTEASGYQYLDISVDTIPAYSSGSGSSTPSGMENPMTTQGDLIVGGTDGAPERLAKGTTGQVLEIDSNGDVSWGNKTKLYMQKMSFSITGTDEVYEYVRYSSTDISQFTASELKAAFISDIQTNFGVKIDVFDELMPGYYYGTIMGVYYSSTLSFALSGGVVKNGVLTPYSFNQTYSINTLTNFTLVCQIEV